VFYMMAGLCFIAFVLVLHSMPACCPIDRQQHTGLLVNVRLMLQRRRTIGILIARFATVLMMVPTMAFLPVIMSQWQGSSGLQVGVVIASRTLMNAVLQVPFGKLADRCDKVKLLVSGCVCMSLAIFLIPSVHNFPTMVVMYLFLGFGEAVLWPVLGAYAAEEGRNHFGHGTMMGVFNLAMSAGVLVGALLAGTSMDSWGTRQAFYVTAAAIMILTGVSAALIRAGENGGENAVVK
jgi:DHA1 family multidrug resistance protein-like MFS transporter